MNHDEAAELRDELNDVDSVEGTADSMTNAPYRYARIIQPGFTNGKPEYGVVLDAAAQTATFPYIPRDVIDVVTDAAPDAYIRVEPEEDRIQVRRPMDS
jgi:hypothetical protein